LFCQRQLFSGIKFEIRYKCNSPWTRINNASIFPINWSLSYYLDLPFLVMSRNFPIESFHFPIVSKFYRLFFSTSNIRNLISSRERSRGLRNLAPMAIFQRIFPSLDIRSILLFLFITAALVKTKGNEEL
jgi:hypothetical protein